MTRRLRDEDRRTIDLLLDGAAGSGSGNGSGNGHSQRSGNQPYPVSHHGVTSEARVSAAQRVLSLLDALPPEEPSVDLLERTMRRIEGGRRSVGTSLPANFDPGSQPHA